MPTVEDFVKSTIRLIDSDSAKGFVSVDEGVCLISTSFEPPYRLLSLAFTSSLSH